MARRPRPEAGMLLLGPTHADAHAAAVAGLRAAGVSFHRNGSVLVVPLTGCGRGPLLETLAGCLMPATQRATRAAFFGGDVQHAGRALGAFVSAEPLSALVARQEHEWVRAALDDGWLFSVFHPIVEAESSRVFAYESLIRAQAPGTQEVIGAWPIIHACEQLDLQHVLDQRARQTAIRNAAALGLPHGKFFINFLPNTIYDPEICLRTTMETAAECGMDVSRLVFEVVETENIPDLKRLQHILDYYRSRGVGTAVDDMGAGFSSIEYLTALHPDYVKLDRALVVDAENDNAARQKMAEIIDTAKHLGICVIAEGIETRTQRQVCLDLGADLLQGFLFARPANPPQSVRCEGVGLRLAA